MPNTYVVLQDPDHWGPLSDVTVRAIDADTGDIADTQVTDKTGYAVFDTTGYPTNYYFKPELTRTRIHMLVMPPFGYDLYGIDAAEDYVDGRTGWTVRTTGAVNTPTEIQTSPDGTVMVHVDRINTSDFGDAYRSNDDGATWAALSVPAANLSCASLAFAADGKLWSAWITEPGTDDGTWIYSSTDYGTTWTFVQKIAEVGLGFTFAQRIRVDQETGYVALTRFGELGSSAKYFKGGVDGVSFPTADSSGVQFSGDTNGGDSTGLMEFTEGRVTVASARGTGGSTRIRLHNMAEDGSAFTDVYEKAPGADAIKWSQFAYVSPGNLFVGYARATGGSGMEGLLRSSDAGQTWTEIDVPAGFIVRGVVYDPQLDILYIFKGGAGSGTYYSLETPMSAPASGADWVAQTGPTTLFDSAREWQVTWVPKGG